jgi:hypothetical protein
LGVVAEPVEDESSDANGVDRIFSTPSSLTNALYAKLEQLRA